MKTQSAPLILMLFAFLFSLVEVQAEEINKSFIGEWILLKGRKASRQLERE